MRTIAVLPLLMIVSAASAADLPRRPAYVESPLPAAPTWSGFYVGGNVGGGWAKARSDFSTTGPIFGTANNQMSGVAGGLTLGYNWQSGPLVLGAETDFQFANLDGSLSTSCSTALCGMPLSATYDQKVPWFGTVRGRVGYAQDGWMAYATGGYAYARLETNASATAGAATASMSQSSVRSGWTAGGGIEVALTTHWSAKAEYLYMDFGSNTMTWSVPGLPTLASDTKLNMNVVRAGVNYRF
ncbi:porin family protein [Microbacteriaceae bacterium K1510]|nr:porin family protein [Microbacteriaceae bacterium K1510]